MFFAINYYNFLIISSAILKGKYNSFSTDVLYKLFLIAIRAANFND